MENLIHYVITHSSRMVPFPDMKASADMIFFHVIANDANADELRMLVKHNTTKGAFCNVDPLDGHEHSYLELGGWIGDQGLALSLMGLGSLLGLWTLMTPRTVFGDSVDDDAVRYMAGSGYITIKAA